MSIPQGGWNEECTKMKEDYRGQLQIVSDTLHRIMNRLDDHERRMEARSYSPRTRGRNREYGEEELTSSFGHYKIFKILGTPNDKIWPSYSHMPGVEANFVRQPHNLLHKKFPRASFTGSPVLSDLGLDLLSKLLTYDPEKRITVNEALNHRWFQEAPLPMPKDYMPTFPAEKMLICKLMGRKQSALEGQPFFEDCWLAAAAIILEDMG